MEANLLSMNDAYSCREVFPFREAFVASLLALECCAIFYAALMR
jgi:hypothetical protein